MRKQTYTLFVASNHRGSVRRITVPLYAVHVLAVLAVVGVFYYLRIARSIYLEEPPPGAAPVSVHWAQHLAIVVSAAAVVILGVFPRPWIDSALRAAAEWKH